MTAPSPTGYTGKVDPVCSVTGDRDRAEVRRRTRMPTKLEDTSTGADGFVFPDSLENVKFEMTENAVFSAYEVRVQEHSEEEAVEDDYEAQKEGQTPAYGRWIPAHVDGRDGEQWVAAPGEFIEELQTYDDPVENRMRVSRCRKSGPDESDPYEVNITPDPR